MSDAPAPASRWPRVITWTLAVLILLPSLYGFAGKFLEFIHIYRGDGDGAFAILPILNYLMASLGFLCLFAWALLQGMFSDIEQPKRTMLELDAALDRRAAGEAR